MKRILLISCFVVATFSVVVAIQNRFLLGLPFIHPGSDLDEVERYMGNAEYHGDIGATNNVYFVRILFVIVATVNVNINTQGIDHFNERGGISSTSRPVNSIKWKTMACFDRREALALSLPRPDRDPYWP
jgi:hypothetical protein